MKATLLILAAVTAAPALAQSGAAGTAGSAGVGASGSATGTAGAGGGAMGMQPGTAAGNLPSLGGMSRPGSTSPRAALAPPTSTMTTVPQTGSSTTGTGRANSTRVDSSARTGSTAAGTATGIGSPTDMGSTTTDSSATGTATTPQSDRTASPSPRRRPPR